MHCLVCGKQTQEFGFCDNCKPDYLRKKKREPINPDDKDFSDKLYKIYLSPYGYDLVYANDDVEALDIVADHYYDKGADIFVEEDDDTIPVGNYGLYIDSTYLIVKKVG